MKNSCLVDRKRKPIEWEDAEEKELEKWLGTERKKTGGFQMLSALRWAPSAYGQVHLVGIVKEVMKLEKKKWRVVRKVKTV